MNRPKLGNEREMSVRYFSPRSGPKGALQNRYRTLISRPILTRQGQNRGGLAAIEFAICLPVLTLLVFGSIEATAFIFLKQSLHVAAYEGVRNGSRADATQADATNRARAILSSRAVRGATIRFVTGDVASVARGEPVIVEVAAPTNVNSPLAGQWIANRTLTSRVFMLKE